MRRTFPVAVAALLVAAACGGPAGVPADPEAAFADRAAIVVEAWRAALAEPGAAVWRTGLVPLQALTVPPNEGLTGDTRTAFTSGWYRLGASLQDGVPARGTVRFPDGTSERAPLTSALAAYRAMDLGDPPCGGQPPPAPASEGSGPGGSVGGPAVHTCAVLTVTAATLGTTRLRTSRGLATVPAWLFTVAELPAPVARVAIAEQALSAPPDPSVPPMAPGLSAARSPVLTAPDRLTYTIGVGACHDRPRGLSYESDEVVVVAGVADPPAGGECAGSLALPEVTVKLRRGFGDRVLLDAGTGRPLALTA